MQRQTTQLLKLKILQKEVTAKYLKQKNKPVSWKIKWYKTSEEQNKVKIMKRSEDSLRDLWDHIKCTNIRIIGANQTNKD